MVLTEIARGRPWQERGKWAPLLAEHASASFSCPGCGQVASLLDHEIAVDGIVTPSVACGTHGCDFHEHVKLVGWVSPFADDGLNIRDQEDQGG